MIKSYIRCVIAQHEANKKAEREAARYRQAITEGADSLASFLSPSYGIASQYGALTQIVDQLRQLNDSMREVGHGPWQRLRVGGDSVHSGVCACERLIRPAADVDRGRQQTSPSSNGLDTQSVGEAAPVGVEPSSAPPAGDGGDCPSCHEPFARVIACTCGYSQGGAK